MTLLVVFPDQNGEDEFAVLVEQPLHCRAMIEEFLYNSEHFVSVLKVSGEQTDVKDNVN